MHSYLPVLLAIIVTAGIVGAVLGLSALIGPKPEITKEKERPFECGYIPFQEPGKCFPVHYYVVAILFIVFDIEIIFLYPWVASFEAVGKTGFFAAIFFILILTFGLVYEWLRGGLEWH